MYAIDYDAYVLYGHRYNIKAIANAVLSSRKSCLALDVVPLKVWQHVYMQTTASRN
jgi:hypothetical protein